MSMKSSLSTILIMLLFCQSTHAALIGHWPFNERLDDIAADLAGNNDGTIVGAQRTSEGLYFDGTNDYVDLGDDPSLNPTDQISLSVWIKTTDSSRQRDIIARWDASVTDGDPRGKSFLLATNVHGNSGKAGFALNASGQASLSTAIHSQTNVADGVWHHIAGVYDHQNMQLYVDGVLEASIIYNFDIYSNLTENVYIGNSDEDVLISSFNGYINDVQIYDHALSMQEIQNIIRGPVMPVNLDIKPQSCPNPFNVKSKGVLPVAILGTEEFDVSTIVPTSVRLAGVEPIRNSLEDVAAPLVDPNECECSTNGPDGFTDLTLKFETQAVLEALGEVNTGDILTLRLTGVLNDETSIEGTDCIVIVGRFKPINKADINKDGVVNAADFAIFTQNWLQSSIVDD